MRILTALVFGLLMQTPTAVHFDALRGASDDELRAVGAALYKCGQITADRQWVAVIDASKSPVRFQIDREKSARDWTSNHCDVVLVMFGVALSSREAK